MATVKEYEQWLVTNQDLKGSPDYNTVATAYEVAKARDGVVSEMGQGERFLAGTGRGMSQLYEGAKGLFGIGPSGAEIQEERQLSAPLIDTAAGKAGEITGQVAALAPLAVVPGANTIGGAAAIGGLSGALQPTAGIPERLMNIGMGAGLGAGAQKIATQPAETFEAVKNVAAAPFRGIRTLGEMVTGKGQQMKIARMLRDVTQTNPNVIQNLRSAEPIVPGSIPTAAEVGKSGGLAALQRGVMSADPESFTARQTSQNEARLAALRAVTPDRAAAELARAKSVNPLLEQVKHSQAVVNPNRTIGLIDRIVTANPKRKELVDALKNVKGSFYEPYSLSQKTSDAVSVLDDALGKRLSQADFDALQSARTMVNKIKRGTLKSDEIKSAIKELDISGKTAKTAISDAIKIITGPNRRVTTEVNALKSASQNIGDLLHKRGPTGAKINEAIARELTTIKKSLDHQIGKAEHAYREYMQTFSQMSRPLNQYDIMREIASRSLNPLDDTLRPSTFASSLTDETAAAATGFKRAKLGRMLEQNQLKTLEDVKRELARVVSSQKLGRDAGPDTAQKLRMMGTVEEASGGGKFNVLERNVVILKSILEALGKHRNVETRQKLAQILLNPQETARIMAMAPELPPPPMPLTMDQQARYGLLARMLALPVAAQGGIE